MKRQPRTSLITHLSAQKSAILDRWLRAIYESYPPETAVFLRKEKDHFDNPVGYRISQGLEGLYGALLQEMETDQILAHLDEIIRIRALQDFAPSQALAFIFLLKDIIRHELADEIQKEDLAQEVLELESRIDGLALLGFDVYSKRREKIHEIRSKEMKSRVSALLRRAGIGSDSI
jgi:hypothetical protein